MPSHCTFIAFKRARGTARRFECGAQRDKCRRQRRGLAERRTRVELRRGRGHQLGRVREHGLDVGERIAARMGQVVEVHRLAGRGDREVHVPCEAADAREVGSRPGRNWMPMLPLLCRGRPRNPLCACAVEPTCTFVNFTSAMSLVCDTPPPMVYEETSPFDATADAGSLGASVSTGAEARHVAAPVAADVRSSHVAQVRQRTPRDGCARRRRRSRARRMRRSAPPHDTRKIGNASAIAQRVQPIAAPSRNQSARR